MELYKKYNSQKKVLQEKLEYTWSEVHQEAELLEHAVSDKLISRMAKVLKDPTHDPHGAPIPTASGKVPEAHLLTLLDVRPDDLVQIEAVQDEDPIKLQYLEESGLTPGVQIKIVKRNSFDQMTTVIVLTSGDLQVVSHELAGDIFVSKIRN